MPTNATIREPLFEIFTVFRGDYPDIPVAQETLVAVAEDDPKPFFTTLRIGKIGVESRNDAPNGKKRLYGERAIQAMMQQVNSGLGGILGHQDPWDSEFPLPVLRWLGTTLDAEGVLWGKAYVPTYAHNVRTYLKDSMKFNAEVGTSIYGNAEFDNETGEVLSLDLEGIDLVGAKRVGVTAAVGIPRVTTETIDKQDQTKESAMSETTEVQAVETTPISEQVITLTAEVTALQTQLAELNTTLETVTSERDSALERVSVLESDLLDTTISNLVVEMVELEPLRPAVEKHLRLLRRVGDVKDAETARGAITAYLTDEDTQAISVKLVNEMSGGNAIVAGRNDEHKLPSEAEAREMGAKYLPKK